MSVTETDADAPAVPPDALMPRSVEEAAELLADGAVGALPGWVERCVASACERAGIAPAELSAPAHNAGMRCAAEVGSRLRELLATDVDEQQTTPLSVLRSAVRFPTQVLADGGVPVSERDDFDASRFPDDPYDLTPASFADIDPELGPIGIAWGAAKAFEVLQRRRIDTAEPARRIDTAEPARRIDTAEPARRIDTAEPARRIDTAEPARRIDTAGQR
ncbi:hypothetical protein [Candidatus Poriferisodalis sp.]|uniref:hypothetical protein n=1 Tax=Candidatus Poriferisodalis sp. TaxID=3101277 RepID=UPI003B01940A